MSDRLQATAAKLEQYLQTLDAADATEVAVPPLTAPARRETLRHRRERKGRYEQLRAALEASGESQISLTDPDSRAMPNRPKMDICYNVPTAVDAKPKLIIAQLVTKAVTDVAQLSAMAITTKAILGVEHLKGVAAMGDYHGEGITTCAEAGIEPSIPQPLTSANRQLGLYGNERVTYAAAQDCYQCPAGQRLTFRLATVALGRPIRYYATTACRTCAITAHCTRHKEGRRMTRWGHKPILERRQTSVEANPGLMKRRPQIVEHPCGTIQHGNAHGYFLMRDVEQGRAAMSLSALAYKIKRILHILGMPAMIAAVA